MNRALLVKQHLFIFYSNFVCKNNQNLQLLITGQWATRTNSQ